MCFHVVAVGALLALVAMPIGGEVRHAPQHVEDRSAIATTPARSSTPKPDTAPY